MSATVIGYYGSKHRLADRLVQLMPAHRAYVEPYAGSCAVLLAKPRAPFECVNDLAEDLMVFWRVLRDRCDDLERVCALTPHSRGEYQHAWPIGDDVDDLERARRVWVKLSQGRGGQLRATGWRYHELTRGRGSGMPATLTGYVGRFAGVAERLRSVSLECLPALDVIAHYGRDPDTLLYVDPPYLGSTRSRTGYLHEMTTADDHRRLAAALHACQAKVMLSGYDCDLYAHLYPGWGRTDLSAHTGQGNNGNGRRTESIWTNYSPGLDMLMS